jgi:hypothetical protein
MMRAIPRRTDPLTRATMPAITSTAAMIHKRDNCWQVYGRTGDRVRCLP